jgi:hypothetical protein
MPKADMDRMDDGIAAASLRHFACDQFVIAGFRIFAEESDSSKADDRVQTRAYSHAQRSNLFWLS